MTFGEWMQLQFALIQIRLLFQRLMLIELMRQCRLPVGSPKRKMSPQAPARIEIHDAQSGQASRSAMMSPQAQAVRSAIGQLKELVEKSGGRVVSGPDHFNKRSTVLRVWFKRVIIFLQYLFFRCLKRIIGFLVRLLIIPRPRKAGMLIFCKDFDKSVEDVRNKKPTNAPVVYTTIARMETEMHGGSQFWKFPAIGEQSIKEQKARGFTLIGVLLMRDQVWLRVINDDFEFDVARQICEERFPRMAASDTYAAKMTEAIGGFNELAEETGGTVSGPGHFNKRSTVLRRWFKRISIWLLIIPRPQKTGMLIFCEDFDKCVENGRNKKPINARVVYRIIAPMETEMHGGSEFWKLPAIGEQVIKEKKARGYTLIGVLLMSDGVWLRVINDDFEFDVARQICEERPTFRKPLTTPRPK